MFQNEADNKGLFTFYREQAELQQRFASEHSFTNKKSQSSKTKNHVKSKHFSVPLDRIHDEQEKFQQSLPDHSEKISPKKSFQLVNKEYIKQLSSKRQNQSETKAKDLASEIVVILKGKRPSKQDLKLNRLNLKYQMHQGHFIKEKNFEPLQQVSGVSDLALQNNRNPEESVKIKRAIKRNMKISNRYDHQKSQLQSQLILSRQFRQIRESTDSFKLQGIKKVDMFNELQQIPQLQRGYVTSNQSSNHIAHKRIPPKALASILKSQNSQFIRQLRKAIDKEKQEERKSAMIQRHHSFIEYGSFDYDKKQMDLGKLNQKQRRMITILNKFSKRD